MNDRTDTKNERAGSRLKTDFLRCFRRQWHAKSRISSALIPAAVAVLVWLAFLFQRNVSGDMDRFVFFSTLYCFWIGLFNACQTLNGAVESGEWSYWVLGFRRSFPRFFFANFLSTLTGTLMQTAVFLGSLFLLSHIAGEAAFSGGNKILFLLGGTNNYVKGLWEVSLLPKWILSAAFLGTACTSASICGVSFGIFISAVWRHAADSLKTAVACIVLVMISSSLVLDEKEKYPFVSDLVSGQKMFQPFKFFKAGTAELQDSGKVVLAGASFVFPQRYFYNVGYLPRLMDKEALNRCLENQNQESGLWEKLYKIGCGQKIKEGHLPDLPGIRKECVPALCGIIFRLAVGEVLAMAFWCAIMLFLAFILIKKQQYYHEIR